MVRGIGGGGCGMEWDFLWWPVPQRLCLCIESGTKDGNCISVCLCSNASVMLGEYSSRSHIRLKAQGHGLTQLQVKSPHWEPILRKHLRWGLSFHVAGTSPYNQLRESKPQCNEYDDVCHLRQEQVGNIITKQSATKTVTSCIPALQLPDEETLQTAAWWPWDIWNQLLCMK